MKDQEVNDYLMEMAKLRLGPAHGGSQSDPMETIKVVAPLLDWAIGKGSVSPEETAKAPKQSAAYAENGARWLRTMIAKPESKWGGDWKLPRGGLLRVLYAMFMPPFRNAIQYAAVDRTRLRLLRLHSQIIQFKAAHGRLPASLAALGVPEFIADPLSGMSFGYTLLKSGGYRLWSPGSRATNPVELGAYKFKPADE